jgi:glycosyltransferase involved in cell wall biosynthesis
MHIAIVTAGGAGMFCGSCMHDNTWARALLATGAEVSLIPTYTPLRVDEQNHSSSRVFFGGINVYLDYRSALWRKIPRWLTRWLDAPAVINLATRFGISNDAHHLGALTVAMLEGAAGPEHQEVAEFVEFVGTQLRPDVICFSNALLAGAVPSLKERFSGPVFCILQGDDIFLEELIEPYKQQALAQLRRLAQQFDGFLVHSLYYRDFMADYLDVPPEKFQQIPLGIDLAGHDGEPREEPRRPFTFGYFARICPEKGLHHLVEAFRTLHRAHPETRLRAGGYLGSRDKRYFRELQRAAGDLGTAFEYVGSPRGHAEKVAFLKSLDVLSVPTVYREPKGLYVLEALANGVPVVQPRHGAFSELIAGTEGGILVEPGNAADLARALEQLLHDSELRLQLARSGQENVRRHYDPATMAARSIEIFRRALAPAAPASREFAADASPSGFPA